MTNLDAPGLSPSPVTAYLGLGTNLGSKSDNLDRAISLLAERVGQVEAVSSYHETQPWGFESQNAFLNACVRLSTSLSPRQLLAETQSIERELGRTQKSIDGAYHDRTIDIDILLYGNATIEQPDLVIPHPLMQERDFVMIPLMEIIDKKQPITKKQ